MLSKSNIVVLPSYYNEGLPKILIEAAACGRAVVTTDHTGCRHAVEPDTAILVPIKDHDSLAEAITSLIQDPIRRQRMGSAARILALKEYDVNSVVSKHIKIYNTLFDNIFIN